MTDLLNDVDTPSDAELIARVRGGDVSAYGVLFSRHKDAANRLARQLVRGPDADDLVSEAFAKVLTVLQGGGGPDVAFRAYLLTAVRRLHVDRVRSGQRLQTTDDMAQFDPGVPFQDTAVAGFETGAAAKAFASLPERWQLVLWHLEVEGQKPADIAALLGMSPNSVSALAYRAREGLRQAFLTMHLSEISETECRWVNEHLGAFVRKGLAKRDALKVQGHLDQCRRCTAMHLELTEVNGNLAGIIAPLLLGAAATGYLAATAGGGVGAAGVLTLLGRARDIAAVHTGAVTAGSVASGAVAAAVATVVVTHVGGKAPDVTADPGVGLTSRPAATAGVTPGPSTGPTPSVSPSASTSTSPSARRSAAPSISPSMVPSLTPSPTVSLAPIAPLDPLPSPTPTDTPTETPSPTDSPTGDPTDVPTDPSQPDDDTPTAEDPVVSPDGTVTVTVRRARSTDVVDVQVVSGSGDTTFVTSGLPDSCTSVAADVVSCTPVPTADPAARFGAVAARAGADWTVVLPLAYPEDMVDDDVHVVVTINGGPAAQGASQTFHPDRTPRFDFILGDAVQTAHTLTAGDVDAYTLRTTAHLPRRVAGLRYTLAGDTARFGTAGEGCEVGGDGTTFTCPDVRDGADVDLPLTADGLTAAADTTITVAPLVAFDDPDATDDATTVRLRPGADLGLDLAVFSANPDRNNLVELTGSLTGAGRAGLARVRYELSGSATFPDSRNAACTVAADGGSMDCPVDTAGATDVDLTVRTTDRNQQATVTIGVLPVAPFEGVGTGAHTSTVTLPDRPVHDLSLTDLVRTGHTVSGTTDRYTLSGTVGGVTDGFRTAYFSLSSADGATFAADQTDPHCTLDSTPGNGGSVRCDGLPDGGRVSLDVISASARTHDVAVAVQPADPFDDPAATDNSATVTGLRPGTHLTLAPHDLGRLHQDAAGAYDVRTTVSGLRDGLDAVSFGIGPGVTLGEVRTAGCRADAGSLLCEGLTDGSPVSFAVTSEHPARATDLTLTASPGGDFVDVGSDNTASAALAPTYDFSLGDLTLRGQTVDGATDTYTLRTSVPALPGDLDAVDLEVTDGGTFATDQPSQDLGGCRRTDATHVRCAGLAAGGRIDVVVRSAEATRHAIGLRLVEPTGYDDPDPTNQTATVSGLSPAVDLHLANLDADNDSPANDDDRHLVSSRLSGVRPGLGSVVYTLTGDAAFVGVDRPGCAADGRTLTCTDPVDGDLTFTVEATDRQAATRIGIAVSPGAPFVELAETDNADSVRLLPRPTYDFALGALDVDEHTVTGGTDHYVLGSRVGALPAGLGSVGFVVTGGTFAPGQASGCSTLDATHVSCGDLAGARRIAFRVDSGADARHEVAIALVAPRRYVDPDPSDDRRTVDVEPAVDLHLGTLVPSAPLPEVDGSFVVTTALTGVRGGQVGFTISGATVTDSSCAVGDAHTVTCASPTEGQRVTFTLVSGQPRGVEAVTIRASSGSSLTELDPGDNTATTSLAPDVAIGTASVTGHRGVHSSVAVVRSELTGVPVGVSQLRMRLSGAAVGSAADQVHLTNGAAGSDGEGGVDCYVSDAVGRPVGDGTYATCTGVGSARSGSFWVDLRVRHPHGTPTPLTVTVLPIGVDEGSHGTANNSRDLTVD